MASYTLKDIDNEFWKKVKGETGYRGVQIKSLIMDFLKTWVRDSQVLRKRERKANLK